MGGIGAGVDLLTRELARRALQIDTDFPPSMDNHDVGPAITADVCDLHRLRAVEGRKCQRGELERVRGALPVDRNARAGPVAAVGNDDVGLAVTADVAGGHAMSVL